MDSEKENEAKQEEKHEDTSSVTELTHDYYCGIYKWRPKSLQVFVTAKFFIPLLCLNTLLQSAFVNGLNSAVLSSVERRYRFGSTAASFILSSYDFAVLTCILFVSYFGGKGHKPRWLGWGLLIMGTGALLFASPQFFFGRYEAGSESEARDETCQDDRTANPECDRAANAAAYALFIISQIITGIGTAGLYTVGVSFLDDIVHPKWVSLTVGIFFLCSIFGPALGFLVGGAFLSIYVDPWESTNLTEEDPSWVGAWWIMYVVVGVLSILLAIPVLMFPRFTPTYRIIQMARRKMMARRYKSRYGEEKKLSQQLKVFPIHLKKLLTNPTWLFTAIGVTSLFFSLNALVGFGPKYVEAQFGIPASTASILIGAAAIVSAVTGIIAGSGVMHFFKGQGRKAAFIHAVAVSIAILPVFGFFAFCPTPNVAGIEVDYATPSGNSSDQLISQCNADCNCSTTIFNPVCGSDDISYFSPCHAGCFEGLVNCTCVFADGVTFEESGGMLGNGTASDGLCNQGCNFIAIFVICIIILTFLVFVAQISIVTVKLRCVADEQRSLSLGLNSLLSRSFGSVPGPVLIGTLFDLSCIYFQDDCGSEGNCLVYDNTALALRIFGVSVAGVIADTIFAWLAWGLYKNAPQVTEPHAENPVAGAESPVAELNKELPNPDEEKKPNSDASKNGTSTSDQNGELTELVEFSSES